MQNLTNVDLGSHQRIRMEEVSVAAARRKTKEAAAAGNSTHPLFRSA
jgi:hypothetical protein